jgi:hypothetical protein
MYADPNLRRQYELSSTYTPLYPPRWMIFQFATFYFFPRPPTSVMVPVPISPFGRARSIILPLFRRLMLASHRGISLGFVGNRTRSRPQAGKNEMRVPWPSCPVFPDRRRNRCCAPAGPLYARGFWNLLYILGSWSHLFPSPQGTALLGFLPPAPLPHDAPHVHDHACALPSGRLSRRCLRSLLPTIPEARRGGLLF